MHGWPSTQSDCVEQVRSYFTFKEEISSLDGLLFKGQRLIVTTKLRHRTLQVLHRSHIGITKTQERARTTFYWPGMDRTVKDTCQTSKICLEQSNKQEKINLGLVPDSSEAWDSVACYLFEFKGKIYLIVACRFSSYIVVREVKNHSTEETIDQFSSIFAEHGIPTTIHSDRGTNFRSKLFQDFCHSLNIKVTYSSVEHHSSNYAERAVQTVKNFMKRNYNELKLSLLEYLMTPVRLQGSNNSPLKLMSKRNIRGILPTRKQESNTEDYDRMKLRRQEQAKHYKGTRYDIIPMGASVMYYDHNVSKWTPGIVVERVHDRQYVIVSERGRKISRNRQDIKLNPNEVKVQFTLPKMPLGSQQIVPRTLSLSSQKTFPKSSDSSKDNNSHTQGHQPSLPFKSSIKSTHLPRKTSSLQETSSCTRDCQKTTPVSAGLLPASVKSAKIQGKVANVTDSGSSESLKSTHSGRTVRKPSRFRDC